MSEFGSDARNRERRGGVSGKPPVGNGKRGMALEQRALAGSQTMQPNRALARARQQARRLRGGGCGERTTLCVHGHEPGREHELEPEQRVLLSELCDQNDGVIDPPGPVQRHAIVEGGELIRASEVHESLSSIPSFEGAMEDLQLLLQVVPAHQERAYPSRRRSVSAAPRGDFSSAYLGAKWRIARA